MPRTKRPLLSRTPAHYRMPDQISLRAIGQILGFEWRVIAVCTVLFVILGVFYCSVTKPKYEATVEIVPGDFTTKSTAIGANITGLASLVLSGGTTQSDAVKRFITVLYSPDLARRLASDDKTVNLLGANGKLGRLGRLMGGKEEPWDYPHKVLLLEGELSKIEAVDSKKTLATNLRYQSTDRQRALDFLRVATKQGDEILRQYNVSEIAYDDLFLNRALAEAQNVDVRLALAQNLVQTEMRKMQANRSEYFSIRTLGPVEAPINPVWPKWSYVVGGTFFLGFLIGTIFVFTRTYLRYGATRDDTP